MLVAGIVLLVVAVGLVVWHVVSRRKIAYLTAARRRGCGELLQTARTLAEEIGEGGLKELVEVVGRIECEAPLVSPLGEHPCVHYTMRVVHEYEERYTERDQDGTVRHKTRRGSDTMSTQTESRDFALLDDSGAVQVRLDGADFDELVKTVDRFEQGDGVGMGGNLRLGRFSMSLGALGSGRRTLGFRYEERVVPLDRALTVVGEATDGGGEISVGRGGPTFIVSTRSKAEILGGAEKAAKISAILSGVCAVVGIGLTIAGLVAG